jgi:hypothetical protein
VESAKRYGRFGRSCRVCKLYFLTNDPNTYICPWCQKGEKEGSLAEGDTQMLVQEEV